MGEVESKQKEQQKQRPQARYEVAGFQEHRKPVKSQIYQLEKAWPNEVRQEGRSYAKEFESFLNSGGSCWIILNRGMTIW